MAFVVIQGRRNGMFFRSGLIDISIRQNIAFISNQGGRNYHVPYDVTVLRY
jgi:hypothetical protein